MNTAVENWRKSKRMGNYLNQEGKLLVWTKISSPPEGFEYLAPYFVGIIKLKSGEKLPLQLIVTDEKNLKVGAKVLIVLRRGKKVAPDEIIEYSLKAKLI